MERGLRRGSIETVAALAIVLDIDREELEDIWRYVSDAVTAAILESELSDSSKRELLRHYDRLRRV